MQRVRALEFREHGAVKLSCQTDTTELRDSKFRKMIESPPRAMMLILEKKIHILMRNLRA